MIKTFLSVTYAPAIFLGAISSGIYMLFAGLPLYSLVIIFFAVLILSFLVEKMIPYEPEWNLPDSERPKDIAHVIVNESSLAIGIFCIHLFRISFHH